MRFAVLVVLGAGLLAGACEHRNPNPRGTDDVGAKFGEEDGSGLNSFAYTVRQVVAPDGGLVGIEVIMRNKSDREPLQMRSAAGQIPVGLVLTKADGKILVGVSGVPLLLDGTADARNREKPKDREEAWTIPVSSTKDYFVPLQRLIRLPPDVDRIGPCALQVVINAFPMEMRRGFLDHPYPSQDFRVLITRQGIEMDPAAALASARDEEKRNTTPK